MLNTVALWYCFLLILFFCLIKRLLLHNNILLQLDRKFHCEIKNFHLFYFIIFLHRILFPPPLTDKTTQQKIYWIHFKHAPRHKTRRSSQNSFHNWIASTVASALHICSVFFFFTFSHTLSWHEIFLLIFLLPCFHL